MKKKIVITIGDPAGCGPFIALKALDEFNKKNVEWFVVGDREVLRRHSLFTRLQKRVTLIDIKTAGIKKIKPGVLSALAGTAALGYLKRALEVIKHEKINALVTAPISKEAVQSQIPGFVGHTEFLAKHFAVKKIAMMMVAPDFKVVLLTRHIALRKVSSSITVKLVKDTLEVVHSFLKKRWHIKKPRIAVASINPHAGVDTFFEKEEICLKRAIEVCDIAAAGPFPLDTLFLKDKRQSFDCIIAPYHDAAMIPFKMLCFHNGVNLTCGLPIIRTSPAHGVAFDLMRKGKRPMHCSMLAAMKLVYSLSA